MASLFTRIIRGEIPSFKVYENEHVFAFLDINPVNAGHTLIVPKIEADHFLDVPEPYYTAVFQAAKVVGRAIKDVTGCPRVGTAVVGFEVPHFHYHLVPLWSLRDLDFSRGKKAAPEDLKAMQAKILEALEE
jgi:histidine triad (HIT) family protein